MDFLALLLLLSLLLWTFFHLFGPNSRYKRSAKLPPGPFPIPIIGNILQLGQNPHRSLTKLSEIYGPLMHLKLGTMHAIVVSSPEMAKEILKKHDQACSGRTVAYAITAANHDKVSVTFLPAGSKWRKLRRVLREQMFTMHKMEASEGLRREKLQQLCDHLQERCKNGRAVNIGEVAFITALNSVTSTLFSVDFAQFDSNTAQEMKELVQSAMKLGGTPNLADYFPVLRAIDPRGLKRKTEVYVVKLLEILDKIISERLQSRGSRSDSARKRDLLEALLYLDQENEPDLSRNDIKHLFLDLILAGADTTTASVIWTMTELLRNPEKMLKAKNELRTVVGENKQVAESDISKLSYLNAVIKESFRCHPPGPFLLPRKTEVNVEINGYTIPKGTQILVNVWAIGRDPKTWSNPDSFEPERFLDGKIDYKGQDFELIIFGSGRRICPGLPLAHLMVHLMVATLIHNFQWQLEPGTKPEEMDLNEIFGISLHKAVPLKALPIRQ